MEEGWVPAQDEEQELVQKKSAFFKSSQVLLFQIDARVGDYLHTVIYTITIKKIQCNFKIQVLKGLFHPPLVLIENQNGL